MRILVTGGAGFIGSAFIRYWRDQHPDDQIVAYDVDDLRRHDGQPDLGHRGHRLRRGRHPRHRRRRARPSASTGSTRSSTSPPSPTTRSPCSIRAASSRPTSWAPRPCSRRRAAAAWPASTTSRPARSTATSTSTPTSRSTRRARIGPARPTTRRRPAPTTRCGPTRRPTSCRSRSPTAPTTTGPTSSPRRSIPVFTTRALADQPLPLYASTQNKREWLHVDDHCRAIEAVLLEGRIGETYHVGSGVEASIEEIADAVLAALGKPQSLKTIVPDRPGHDRRYLLDTTKIRTELGWAPTIEFADGIADTVRWYGEQRGVVGAAARASTRGRDQLGQKARSRALARPDHRRRRPGRPRPLALSSPARSRRPARPPRR